MSSGLLARTVPALAAAWAVLAAPPAAAQRAAAFDVVEATIPELQRALDSGAVTSVGLVQAYLARIAAYDDAGPGLNAMISINPNARAEAAALDLERSRGYVRGPLHGIPFVVKDNYDTADMPTTNASIALDGLVPPDDAFQIRRLREAGAVIVGKTNLHEFARGITTISSLGGQTRNPYDPTRNPGGSSGGTGAAVAASFAAFGTGSDTCGSIRIPSSFNALTGMRFTRGLASRDGVIPLSHTQDVAGPLTRTVRDLAIVMDAVVGWDPADPVTALGVGHVPPTYTAYLEEDGLRGARIGLLTTLLGSDSADAPVADVVRRAAREMEAAGAVVVPVEAPDVDRHMREASVIDQEFPFDLADYLRATPGARVATLREVYDRGLYHESLKGRPERSIDLDSLATPDYLRRMARRDSVRLATLDALARHDLDALLFPPITRVAAPVDEPQQGGPNCLLGATSGLPSIVVPAGWDDHGLPIGIELLGRDFAEPTLLRLAYAYERLTRYRRPPRATPPLH